MKYIECEGIPNVGYCSDNECPCSVTKIQQGTGYLFISPEVIVFRKNALSQVELKKKLAQYIEKGQRVSLQQYEPILVCKQGAIRRNLDLSIAAKDAQYWWETQKAPLRATPFAEENNKKNSIESLAQYSAKPNVSGKSGKKPNQELENELLGNSIHKNFSDSFDQNSIDQTNNFSKSKLYDESSVDVVSQFAGTPLEEMAVRMADNTNISYAEKHFSTTDTAIPSNSYSASDIFKDYDKSLMAPTTHKNVRNKKTINVKKIWNSLFLIFLFIIFTSGLSYIIVKYPAIKSYVLNKIKKPIVAVVDTNIPVQKNIKNGLTEKFFVPSYFFKDNLYHGTIQFSGVTFEKGKYKQEVFIKGKDKTYYVQGTFAYNEDKIVFRPKGTKGAIIWMLHSINFAEGRAEFYDPKKANREEAVISLTILKQMENSIVISSDPIEATVIINDSIMGKTPFSWNEPSFYGFVDLMVEKKGYDTVKLELEYTGGSVKKHFLLSEFSDTIDQELNNSSFDTLASFDTVVTVDSNASAELDSTSFQNSDEMFAESYERDGTIFLSSLPPMADVYMDGVKIGKTNLDECKVSAGKHTMKFVKGSKKLIKEMVFVKGKNPSQLVRLK